MNKKRAFKSSKPAPEFLHEIKVQSGSKTYTLAKGQLVSVHRRPGGLIAGKYEFCFAQQVNGELLINVEGPISRERRSKVIRVADIKQVHIRSQKRS